MGGWWELGRKMRLQCTERRRVMLSFSVTFISSKESEQVSTLYFLYFKVYENCEFIIIIYGRGAVGWGP